MTQHRRAVGGHEPEGDLEDRGSLKENHPPLELDTPALVSANR
jgi:hypothetical protein